MKDILISLCSILNLANVGIVVCVAQADSKEATPLWATMELACKLKFNCHTFYLFSAQFCVPTSFLNVVVYTERRTRSQKPVSSGYMLEISARPGFLSHFCGEREKAATQEILPFDTASTKQFSGSCEDFNGNMTAKLKKKLQLNTKLLKLAVVVGGGGVLCTTCTSSQCRNSVGSSWNVFAYGLTLAILCAL